MARVSLDNIGRSFMFGTLAEGWKIGSRLILTPIVLAHVGLRGYGVWTLLFSLAAYVSIANVGFGVSYVRFTAECVRTREYDRLQGIIGAGITAVGAISVVALAFAWFFGSSLLRVLNVPEDMLGDGQIAMMIVLTVLVMRLTLGCSLEVLAGLQRIDLTHRLTIVASFVEFAVTVPLLFLGHGLVGMAIGYGVGQLSCFLLGFRWVRRENPQVRISPLLATFAGLRPVMRIGGPMQLLSFVHVMMAEGVKVLLSVMIDPRATALYGLADKLVHLARTPTAAVVGPLLAAFADLRAAGEKARERDMLRGGHKAVAIVGCSVAAFLAAIAGPALLAWTGQDVPLAAWAVQMMVLANLFTQQTAVHSASLRAQGNVKLEFIFAMVSSSVAVAILLILVPIAPFEAVVWSRAGAQVLGGVWFLRASFAHVQISFGEWWRSAGLARVLIVAAGGGVAVVAGRALVGLPHLPLSPRAMAVVDVLAWSLPYVAIVGLGMWKYALDAHEREHLRAMVGRRLRRSRRSHAAC